MASISSTSSATQYGLQQLRVQQATRNAEQAEQTAQALKSQANAAQRVADNAQESARSLTVQSDQASRQAGQARQGIAALSGAQQAVSDLSSRVDQVAEKQAIQIVGATATISTSTVATPVTEASAGATSAAVVNAQGQVTGTIINTTA